MTLNRTRMSVRTNERARAHEYERQKKETRSLFYHWPWQCVRRYWWDNIKACDELNESNGDLNQYFPNVCKASPVSLSFSLSVSSPSPFSSERKKEIDTSPFLCRSLDARQTNAEQLQLPLILLSFSNLVTSVLWMICHFIFVNDMRIIKE